MRERGTLYIKCWYVGTPVEREKDLEGGPIDGKRCFELGRGV
jgi:hypothetical protein